MDIYSLVVVPALEEAKNSNTFKSKEPISPDVVLMGENAVFDSLGFVSFIIVVEERVTESTGKSISLVDDKAFSRKNSPFKTAGSLSKFIEEQLNGT